MSEAGGSSNSHPSAQEVAALGADVESALKSYALAQSPDGKSRALQALSQSSQRLANATADPDDAFSDFTFQPLANACVRAGLAIGLFDQLSAEEPRSAKDLAKLTNAELDLTERILRALAALDVIQGDGSGRFWHSRLSALYTDKSHRAWAVWMWDVMIYAGSSIGAYFTEHGPATPTDSAKSPFCFAYGKSGTNLFGVLAQIGKLGLMSEAMSGSSKLCARHAVASYPFDQLEPGEDGVVLVDVGGGRGETLMEIKKAHPNLKGNFVLQDLESVVKGGVSDGLDAKVQAYDFFSQDQPVKGAGGYFYQRIFHDWSDENCQKILRSLRPAMRPRSKLIISDVVVQDVQPPTRKILRDMNMLLVAGKERSEKQWHDLLESEGFSIVKIYGLQNVDNSVIEARLSSS